MNMAATPNLSLALKLAQAGLPVFPCTEAPGLAHDKEGNPKKDKAPYTANGFKDATTDTARIQGWWARWPGAVPGIPTGEASGLSVIDGDIDRDTGEAVGERQVAELDLLHPDAVKVRTQSGGVQIIYKHVEGARTASHNVASNIDTRGAGGYIIAPGARMQDGATYRYEGRTLSKAIEAGNLPAYPLEAVEAAIKAEKARRQTEQAEKAERVQIDTGGSYGQTEASEAETLEVVQALLSEAPNTLCREDWVKLAVSLRVAYGDTLRDAFTSFSLGYMGGTPCTAQDAAHVWQSSGAAHTVTDIRPALALLKQAVGPERFKQAYRNTFDKTREQGQRTTETPPKQDKPKRRFKLIRADKLEFREPDWLVKGLIEADTLSLVFGDPGCGKSFVAFDLAASIATGRAFHGHETKRGAVIYVCGEGHNGIKRRLMAWEKHTGQRLDNQPLYISQVSAQFLDPASVAELTEAIDEAAQEAEIPVAMIIIDTLNRNMGAGDESNTKDMTMFIAAVDAAKARYKAGALIVHHTGHGNKERARGSYSLHGALDHEYRMEKIDQAFTLTNTKMKEGAPPAPLGFKLVEVVVGRTRLGEDVTSAALEVTEAPKREYRLKASWKLALDTLKEAKKRAGHGDDPSQFIDLEAWRDVYYEKSPADNPRQVFHRARQELVAAEILLCHENNYRISKLVPPFNDA